MKRELCMIVLLSAGAPVLAGGTSEPPVRAEAKPGQAFEVGTLLSSGRENLAAGKCTEAVALFEKALSIDPANPEAVFGLSASFIELKRYAEALPLLEKLNKEVPENPMVRNNLAWALLHIRGEAAANAPRAIKLARAALLDVPSDVSVWNTLGEAYYAAGNFEKALQAARSGLRLSVLAGITNSPCSELVTRCRKAAGAAALETLNPDRPE